MEKCALTADFFLVMTSFYTVGGACCLLRLIICYYRIEFICILPGAWCLGLFALFNSLGFVNSWGLFNSLGFVNLWELVSWVWVFAFHV